MSNIKGLNELVSNLNAIGKKGEDLVKDELEAIGYEMEFKAKQLAPVDLGTLRRSIGHDFKPAELSTSLFAGGAAAPYAPYQEFGTGGLVNVPEELRELAEYYKGKGVKKIDIRPQPFIYPAYIEGRKNFIENLKKGLELLVK